MFFQNPGYTTQELHEFIDTKVFLSAIGLPQYEETFKTNIGDAHGLPFKKLKALRINHLPMMNITLFDHQKMIMRGVEQLFSEFEQIKIRMKENKEKDGQLAKDLDQLLAVSVGGLGVAPPHQAEGKHRPSTGPGRQSGSNLRPGSSGGGGGGGGGGGAAGSTAAPRSRLTSQGSEADRADFHAAAWKNISRTRGQLDKGSKQERLQMIRRQSMSQRSTSNGGGAGGGGGGGRSQAERSVSNAGGGRSSLRSLSSTVRSQGELTEAQKARQKARDYGDAALRQERVKKDLLAIRQRVLGRFQQIINCERASLMFVDDRRKEIFFFDESDHQRRFPSSAGIAGHVVSTGERLNIPDAYSDPRFNREMDKLTGFHTRNILCAPIRTYTGQIVAVVQMLNKRDEDHFSHNDEGIIEACGTDVAEVLAPKYRDLLEAMEDFADKGALVHTSGPAQAKATGSRYLEETRTSKVARRESLDRQQAVAAAAAAHTASRRPSLTASPRAQEVARAHGQRERRLSYGKEVREQNYKQDYGEIPMPDTTPVEPAAEAKAEEK